MVWKNPLEALKDKGWRGIGNYKFLSLALFVIMVGFYWGFSKPEYKSPDAAAVEETGLVGTYYRTDAEELYDLVFKPKDVEQVLERTVPGIEFPQALEDDDVARFKGYFEAPRKGFYEFRILTNHKVDMRFADIKMLFKEQGVAEDGRKIMIGQIHLEKGLHNLEFFVYGNHQLEGGDVAAVELFENEEQVKDLPVEVDVTYSFPNRESGKEYELTTATISALASNGIKAR